MKLKIISDGTSHGTRIVDAETGKNCDFRIKEITFTVSDRSPWATVDLTVIGVPVELQGDVRAMNLRQLEFPERESRS